MLTLLSRPFPVLAFALIASVVHADDFFQLQLDTKDDLVTLTVSQDSPCEIVLAIGRAIESYESNPVTVSVSSKETFPRPTDSSIRIGVCPDSNGGRLVMSVPDSTPFKTVASLVSALDAATSTSVSLVTQSTFDSLTGNDISAVATPSRTLIGG